MTTCQRHDFQPAGIFTYAGGTRQRPQYRCTACGARWLPTVPPSAPIYDALAAGGYAAPDAIQRHPRRNPMTLAADVETAIADAKDFLGAHFGSVLAHAQQIEGSPVAQALEAAALGPAGEQLVVDFIGKLAAFAQAVTPAPAVAAAEPAPLPEIEPAGPYVAGQA